MNSNDKRDVIKFLQRIGVDTRFISILSDDIYINNQRFARFSSKRQETFNKNFPDFKICRSMILQKICTRASRILANSIEPGEKIYVCESGFESFIINVIMEPYTRKYGIEIVKGSSIEDENFKLADSLVSPLTLDDEVEKIVGKILNGERIEPSYLNDDLNYKNDLKIIFPLLNIPRSWIVKWYNSVGIQYNIPQGKKIERETVNFLEGFIPDVRENLLKSAVHVYKEGYLKKRSF